jgi:hypothetical protein
MPKNCEGLIIWLRRYCGIAQMGRTTSSVAGSVLQGYGFSRAATVVLKIGLSAVRYVITDSNKVEAMGHAVTIS